MTTQKPWYLSKTVWAALITILTGIAGLFDLPLGGIDVDATAEQLLGLITAVSGALALVGRFQAKARIR